MGIDLSLLGEQERRVAEKLRRELGSAICAFLEDKSVVEIMLNDDGKLWVEKSGMPMENFGTMTSHQAESILTTIASVYKTVINRDHPQLTCELPYDGSRFEGWVPPNVAAPIFAIRRKALRVYTLDDYVASGIMTLRQSEILKAAISAKRNILVSGGTGSGKTTLTNALIHHLSHAHPNERPIIIEDTAELQCTSANRVILRATAQKDQLALLKSTLRLRPDRILVGEVRGGDALALLKAWNTGHEGGVATLHADNAVAALYRLEQLVSEASVSPQHETIARTVHVVVQIEKVDAGRRVKEIVSIQGHDGSSYITTHEE